VVDSGLETIAGSILLAAICQGFNDFQGGRGGIIFLAQRLRERQVGERGAF
jgi:hypothetical protein